ncbi:MAG: DedA family protein [Alistipes sp.]|nr:DedA family protein [Alistipes sp.]
MEAFTEFMLDWGYWGLLLSAFVAGSIFPMSSEAVMLGLLALGLHPVGCVLAASVGNTLGGMTCYWIGTLGKTEWITRLGIRQEQLDKAGRFLGGRGAWMAFFSFLPTIGEAIAVVLGLMRSNRTITLVAMLLGKAARYTVIALIFFYLK